MLLIHFCATENALLKNTQNLLNCQYELFNLANTLNLIWLLLCSFFSWMYTIQILDGYYNST